MLRLLLITTLLFATPVLAGEKINTTFFGNKAIEGYDPVAYFTQGQAVKGGKANVLEHAGANWYFANRENLEAFRADPEKFAPQYGGYCAYAVGAKNSLAGIDPDAWSIVNGKLYLNYNANIRESWNEKQAEFIVQGDKNWQTLGRE